MPAAPATAVKSRYDIDGFLSAIGDVPVTTDTQRVRLRSRDYFWYSPVLNKQLHGKSADVVATPRDEADVIRVAAACAKLRIPLTPRGAATGNYGQAVPLEGGVLLDLSNMTTIEWQRPGMVRCEPGLKMNDLDAATRPNGWEIAHASLDQAHGDDRRLRRRRLGRHRLGDLWRPARAGQHPLRPRGHAARRRRA